MLTEFSNLAAGVFPESGIDWFLRAMLGVLAVALGRACWRRRTGREERQKEQEATMLAERTHKLAVEKERAEEGNKIKSQLLARISHDVRIPINEVLNTLELALMTTLTREQRDLLEHSKSSAREVFTRLGGTLDISSAEAEKLEVNRIEFSVRDWIRRVVTTIADSVKKNGVELQTDIAADFPDQLVGDPDLLRKVLITLIRDAIKVCPPSKVILVMRVDRRAVKDRRTVDIFFSVESRAVNSERALPRENTLNNSDDGAEPVLPYCDRMLGLMGGQIWVYTQDGRSKICGTVRLERPRPTALETPEAVPAAAPIVSAAGVRALLVEGNRVNQLALLPMLEKQGLRCLVASDGNEAITLLERFALDLVIVYNQGSTPEGLEASRLIREKEKQTGSHVPILALTTHTTRADREACVGAGADACVSMSAPPPQLRKVIETVLPAKSAETHPPILAGT
jgi:CheY-like chemotaxis protein